MLTKKLHKVWTNCILNGKDTASGCMQCRAFASIGVYEENREISYQQLITSPIIFEGRDKFADAEMQCFKSLRELLQSFNVQTIRFSDLVDDWKRQCVFDALCPKETSALATRIVKITPCPLSKHFTVLHANEQEVLLLVEDVEATDRDFFTIDVSVEKKTQTREMHNIHYGRPRILTAGAKGGLRLLR